jgi:hypothetical protein
MVAWPTGSAAAGWALAALAALAASPAAAGTASQASALATAITPARSTSRAAPVMRSLCFLIRHPH